MSEVVVFRSAGGTEEVRWRRDGDSSLQLEFALRPLEQDLVAGTINLSIPCDVNGVSELVRHLERWAVSREFFGCSIDGPPGRVEFSVGGSSSVMTSTDRPAFAIRVITPKLDLTMRMLVDETVVNEFVLAARSAEMIQ